MLIRVNRNGTEIKNFNDRNVADIDKWIDKVLEEYKHLAPRCVFHESNGCGMTVRVYQYNTLYQEIFTIEGILV